MEVQDSCHHPRNPYGLSSFCCGRVRNPNGKAKRDCVSNHVVQHSSHIRRWAPAPHDMKTCWVQIFCEEYTVASFLAFDWIWSVAHVYQLHTLLITVSDIYQYPQHVREFPSIFLNFCWIPCVSYAFANLDNVRSKKKNNQPCSLPADRPALDLMGNERWGRGGDGLGCSDPRLAFPRGRRDDHGGGRRKCPLRRSDQLPNVLSARNTARLWARPNHRERAGHEGVLHQRANECTSAPSFLLRMHACHWPDTFFPRALLARVMSNVRQTNTLSSLKLNTVHWMCLLS